MRYSVLGRITLMTFLIGILAGCQAKSPTLEGQVTIDGQTITDGCVVVKGDDGKTATGPIGPDGRYAVSNAPRGSVKLAISPSAVATMTTPKGKSKGQAAPRTPDYMPIGPSTAASIAIPAKYQTTETSGLTTTLSGGSNRHNLELASR